MDEELENNENTEVVDGEEFENEIDNEEVEDTDGSEEEGEVVTSKNDKKKTTQTAEQDRAFADMRRRLEAVEKEKSDLLNEKLSSEKAKNDKKLLGEYEAKKAEWEEAGYDPHIISEIASSNPILKQILEENQSIKKQFAKQQEDTKLVQEYNSLANQYPELIKSPDDISKEVWQKNQQGYSLEDAFLVVNRDKILNRTKNSVKQKTLNNINSKSHLKTETDGANEGNDFSSVPSDTLANFIDMGMTKKEATAYYKKLYG